MTHHRNFRARTVISAAISCCLLAVSAVRGQVQTTGQQDEEVIRISSELVQTDVMVFDRDGRFIENLKPEQFQMRVDGKPQSVSFFERVAAGTFDEEAQLAAARGTRRTDTQGQTIRPLDRGRAIIFFLDDLHIAPATLPRTRDALLQFVENEMGQNDEMAIFTATGQLGFLQQLTGDKTILRTALKRLAPRNYNISDGERTPMTEAQAIAIESNDRSTLEYFMEQAQKELSSTTPPRTRTGAPATTPPPARGIASTQLNRAESVVKDRANNILQQSTAITKSTLGSLENVVRSAAPIPGRKLLFFISEGFFINSRASSNVEEMRRITDAAARSGTVIYSVNARSLSSGVLDASQKGAFDTSNKLARANSSGTTATQEPLQTLAVETGGRAMLDIGDISNQLRSAVKETATYYLLAWKPEADDRHDNKFHNIEVSIKDRPDLQVRVRRGFLDETPEKAATNNKKSAKQDKKKQPEDELFAALRSLYPRRALPTALSAGYMDSPEAGVMLTASIEVDRAALGFGVASGGKEPAALDLMGAVVNDVGKSVSDFEQNLVITPLEGAQDAQRRVVYNQQLKLAPGLYQVRVAARDRQSGRAGSATQWIDVPDLKKAGFSLSSLFIGEIGDDATQSGQLSLCADHRFPRTSRLGFFLYIYNAARAGAPPDVALQVQIFRDDQPVITRPLFKIDAGSAIDPARLSYGEDIALDTLPTGRYALQVTAIDRIAKATASRRVNFIIE